MESSSVREAHSRSYDHINTFIMSKRIKFSLLEEDSLRVVIPIEYKESVEELRESSKREFWNIRVRVNEIEL